MAQVPFDVSEAIRRVRGASNSETARQVGTVDGQSDGNGSSLGPILRLDEDVFVAFLDGEGFGESDGEKRFVHWFDCWATAR